MQKFGVKAAHHDVGALDQAGHLIEQGGVFNRLRALGAGGRLQLAGDLGAPGVKTGDDRAVARQGSRVVVGVGNAHGRHSGLKAVALRAVARLQTERLHRHYRAAMQSEQAMRRSYKAHRAPAGQRAITRQLVTHNFGDGQFGNSLGQRFLQAVGQVGAAHRAVKVQGLGFTVHAFVQGGHVLDTGA